MPSLFSLHGNDLARHVTPLSLSAVAAAAAVTSILISRLMRKTGEYKEIPIAKGSIPYFGHLRSYLYTSMHDIPAILMAQRNTDLGPIVRYNMGSQSWLVISDADLAYELLNTHGAATSHRAKHTFGDTLDATHHGMTFNHPVSSRWKKTRAILSQYVSPKQLSAHDDILHKEADYTVKQLLASSNKPPLAIFNLLHQSTLNVTLMLAFNYRIEDPEDPLLAKLLDLITISVDNNESLYDPHAFMPFIMGIVDWWKQTQKNLIRMSTEMRPAVIERLIRHGLESDSECLAKTVYAIRDGEDIDDEAVGSICFELLAAGSPTTAVAMTWILVILCNHPNDQEKLQAEIDAFIKIHGRIPLFNDHEHLPLLMSAIKESLRLRPIAPLALGRQVSDDVHCRGYFIPKGTIVRSNVYAMNHDPKLYPNPDRFVVDRFLDKHRTMSTLSKAKIQERDQFAFGFGRRTCPGIFLAENEIFNVMVRLLAQASIMPILDKNNIPVYPDINAFINGGTVMIPAQDTMQFVKRVNPLNL
ncbi:cytochrome P450 [Lichtheimia hyalospora FSU 10163]|nr:cytochrome P450 [Lichtheimia hyalospora FSU 10163]